ncbi:hypothetical protein PYCCODRAFT_382791 [Trametes coccinea BRFM310]|uniref:Uncharacterized protein n=1 Tax=Trametes coccinea (strain BRFM310) TaxID=1353009 RepID=A0A1Y2J3T5_TRAC3|nr:hypothetical protein PYCCODRAFT_382791 [Trametes coccinea BRFM310]
MLGGATPHDRDESRARPTAEPPLAQHGLDLCEAFAAPRCAVRADRQHNLSRARRPARNFATSQPERIRVRRRIHSRPAICAVRLRTSQDVRTVWHQDFRAANGCASWVYDRKPAREERSIGILRTGVTTAHHTRPSIHVSRKSDEVALNLRTRRSASGRDGTDSLQTTADMRRRQEGGEGQRCAAIAILLEPQVARRRTRRGRV